MFDPDVLCHLRYVDITMAGPRPAAGTMDVFTESDTAVTPRILSAPGWNADQPLRPAAVLVPETSSQADLVAF